MNLRSGPFIPVALIFDMDGVLVDSMPSHIAVLSEVFGRKGWSLDSRIVYEMEGAKTIDIIRRLLGEQGLDSGSLELEETLAAYRKGFEARVHFPPFAELAAVLPGLKKHFALAVVSGAEGSIVHSTVHSLFPGIFDIIVSGDDVNAAKPSPEPFLKAAKLLGVNREACLVVENAIWGVEAARRAGMRCVAVSTYVDPSLLEDADMVFTDHGKLVDFLLSLVQDS